MKRVVDREGFDNWMLEKIQSVHYLNNELMDKAHIKLEKEPENIEDQSFNCPGSKQLNNETNVNETPKRKIFGMFRNPFKRKKVSD